MKTYKSLVLRNSYVLCYSSSEMRGNVAVLGSCLKLLAMVDAISLAKVSVSNYDATWEEQESNWLPEDDRADFFKNPPSINDYVPSYFLAQFAQKNGKYTSTDDLPYPQTVVDAIGRRPERDNYYTSSKKLILPRNSFDYYQRKTNPSIKLKLSLKIKLPQAGQIEDKMVSKPKHVTVVDEEYSLPQLSNENPKSEPNDISVDPFVQSFEQINSRAGNILDPRKDKLENKFERLHHTSRIPHTAKSEEVKTPQLLPEPVNDNFAPETTQIDAYLKYLDKVQLLVDKLHALGESQDHPSTESTEGISQLPERLPEGQIKTPDADVSNDEIEPFLQGTVVSQPKHVTVVDEELLPPQLSDENLESESTGLSVDPFVQSFEEINSHAKNLLGTTKGDSEKKIEQLRHTMRIPRVPQEIVPAKSDEIKISQEPVPVQGDFTAETTQLEAYMKFLNTLQLIVDKVHAIGESQDHPSAESTEGTSQLLEHLPEGQIKIPDADLSNDETSRRDLHMNLFGRLGRESTIPPQTSENPQSISELSKDKPEAQIKSPDLDGEGEPAKSDTHDDIQKVPKNPSLPFGRFRINSQLSKDMAMNQMKLSDSESEPSVKEDLRTELNDDVDSNTSEHGKLPMMSQLSKDAQEYRMKINLSELDGLQGEPTEKNRQAKLYDGVPKISQHTFENPQTSSQVKLSDPEYFESDINKRKENYPIENIHEASKKPPQILAELSKTSQLSEDKLKEQVKSSTPDDFESETKEDTHVKIHDEVNKPLNTPFQYSRPIFFGPETSLRPRGGDTRYTNPYIHEGWPMESTKSLEYNNKETHDSPPTSNFFSDVLSWLG